MPPSERVAFEVCVDTVTGLAACTGLVDRIELCAGLGIGGLSPSEGLMQAARASGLETHVLIRPRTGDFEFDDGDLSAALGDIARARELGLAGVVIGAARDGRLDRHAMRAMMAETGDMCVTLHRVIDTLDAPLDALETAVDLGVRRILTSGGARTALEGAGLLLQMQVAAAGRIEIMAGSGINSGNVARIMAVTGVASVHASCAARHSLSGRVADLGFGEVRQETDRDEVARMRDRIDTAAG